MVWPRLVRMFLLGWLGSCSLLIASCKMLHESSHGDDLCPDGPADLCVTAHDPSMMSIAHDLDHLEKHIDWYGSVVPKTPDVWGQARLTKHRQEFEDEMVKELSRFEFKLAGKTQRQDQLFFVNALALNLAVSGRNATQTLGTGTTTTNLNVNNSRSSDVDTSATVDATTKLTSAVKNLTESGKAEAVTKSSEASETTEAKNNVTAKDKASNSVTSGATNEAKQETKLLPVPTTATIISNDTAPPMFNGFTPTTQTINLEPSEFLVQKNRYLNYLNQFRRNGEGDDTADSPGYSLNLLRVPVSVLPGKRTDVGFGAEVTMTLTAELGEEFLPWMFRKLVMNDLMEHMGYTLTKILDDTDYHEILNNVNRCRIINHPYDSVLNLCKEPECVSSNVTTLQPTVLKLAEYQAPGGPKVSPPNALRKEPALLNPYALPQLQRMTKTAAPRTVISAKPPKSPQTLTPKSNEELIRNLNIYAPPLPSSKGVFFRSPMPASQMLEVYGIKFSFEIACSAYEAMGYDVETHGYAHLPDVQAFLAEEANAAYRLLMEPTNIDLWEYCSQDLVTKIRNRDSVALENIRNNFRKKLAEKIPVGRSDNVNRMEYGKTAAFAWVILVDAALLTDRLVQDMRETASAKGAVLDNVWRDYALPQPSPEARNAFNQYVQLRWPIRVFSLDPDVEEQNISDRLTTRREMQQALSLAFVTGRMTASSFTRYARRLDSDYETIALNRTQVGFSHGENTFGWRFYPRFQTPDTASHFEAFFRDTLIGGPNQNHLLRKRRLEPGPRECVALVMMPSFVPYLTLDTTSNWFDLTNPKHKVLDHTEALKLSKTIKSLQTHGGNPRDAQAYRDTDQRVLRSRVEQLANRLPFQSSKVQVPMSNTVGGHGMFNNGITDLAPELYGFYGAPGVDKEAGSTIFLVGDHFSVNRTEVIVGNRAATKVTLLSRQVAKVELAAGTFETEEGYFRVHVATPYGVSRDVEIPLVKPTEEKKAEPAKAEGFTIAKNELKIVYKVENLNVEKGHFEAEFVKTPTAEVVITCNDALGAAPKKIQFQAIFAPADNAQRPPVPTTTMILPLALPDGKYVLSHDGLTTFGKDILTSMNRRYSPYPIGGGVLAQKLTFAEIRITPLDDANNQIGKTVIANNSIDVIFTGVGPIPPAQPVLPAIPVPPAHNPIPPAQ